MASVHVAYENQNPSLPPSKVQQQHYADMTSITPRKPLGELHTNSLITPQPATHNLKRAVQEENQVFNHTSPLKRSSIHILDQDKGFQYLKRRKLSPPRSLSTSTDPSTRPQSTNISSHSSQQIQPSVRSHVEPLHHAPASPSSDADSDSTEDEAKSRQSSQHSFTSLINYDPSSQLNGPTPRPGYQRLLSSHQQQQQHHRLHNRSQHLDAARLYATAVAGRAYAASRAQALRLRLRMALYKVVTGQTHVPFNRLGVSRAKVPGDTRGRCRWAIGDVGKQGVVAAGHQSADELFGPPIDAVRRRRESSGEETIVAGDGEGR